MQWRRRNPSRHLRSRRSWFWPSSSCSAFLRRKDFANEPFLFANERPERPDPQIFQLSILGQSHRKSPHPYRPSITARRSGFVVLCQPIRPISGSRCWLSKNSARSNTQPRPARRSGRLIYLGFFMQFGSMKKRPANLAGLKVRTRKALTHPCTRQSRAQLPRIRPATKPPAQPAHKQLGTVHAIDRRAADLFRLRRSPHRSASEPVSVSGQQVPGQWVNGCQRAEQTVLS